MGDGGGPLVLLRHSLGARAPSPVPRARSGWVGVLGGRPSTVCFLKTCFPPAAGTARFENKGRVPSMREAGGGTWAAPHHRCPARPRQHSSVPRRHRRKCAPGADPQGRSVRVLPTSCLEMQDAHVLRGVPGREVEVLCISFPLFSVILNGIFFFLS